jgi:hypothetical protein
VEGPKLHFAECTKLEATEVRHRPASSRLPRALAIPTYLFKTRVCLKGISIKI